MTTNRRIEGSAVGTATPEAALRAAGLWDDADTSDLIAASKPHDGACGKAKGYLDRDELSLGAADLANQAYPSKMYRDGNSWSRKLFYETKNDLSVQLGRAVSVDEMYHAIASRGVWGYLDASIIEKGAQSLVPTVYDTPAALEAFDNQGINGKLLILFGRHPTGDMHDEYLDHDYALQDGFVAQPVTVDAFETLIADAKASAETAELAEELQSALWNADEMASYSSDMGGSPVDFEIQALVNEGKTYAYKFALTDNSYFVIDRNGEHLGDGL